MGCAQSNSAVKEGAARNKSKSKNDNADGVKGNNTQQQTCQCAEYEQTGDCSHLAYLKDFSPAKDDEDIVVEVGTSPLTGDDDDAGATSYNLNFADGINEYTRDPEDLLNLVISPEVGKVEVPDDVKYIGSDTSVVLIDLLAKASRGLLVYRAAIDNIGIVCCKSLICMEARCNPRIMSGFNTELQMLHELNHPNLLTFYGYQEQVYNHQALERRLYVEFFVDNLHTLVRNKSANGRRLGFLNITLYSLHIARALSYLHGRGLMHRNLSSDNIMMAQVPPNMSSTVYGFGNEDGNDNKAQQQIPRNGRGFPLIAKLSDFGDMKRFKTENGLRIRASTMVGNPQYLAPEIFRREDYDESADVWSLGCIMYEMISKARPFGKKATFNYIESKVTSGKFPKDEPIGPQKVLALEQIMRQCLHLDPLTRLDANELVNELNHFV